MDVTPVHAEDRARFEVEVDGKIAYLTYERHGNTVAMTHTIVPREIEGRGIAGRLTETAVRWAREQSLSIDPQCSYVRSWLSQNG